nr:gustatory receptor 19 [Papilio glaucus]
MSSPNIILNRFEQNVKKKLIDPFTKLFIIIELFFGVNRLRVFDKVKFVYSIPVLIYCFCVNAIFSYFVLKLQTDIYVSFIAIVNITSYIINSIWAILSCNKYQEFFKELKSLDAKFGLNSGIGLPTIKNVVIWGIIIVTYCVATVTAYALSYVTISSLYTCIMHTVFTTELFSYGHLMTLLLRRLHYFKKNVMYCLANDEAIIHTGKINKREQCRDTTVEEFRRLVLFYHGSIKAFDALNAAIKYQFFVILLESFITSICYWNFFVVIFSSGKMNFQIMPALILIVFIATFMPFFSPCHFANQIKVEVCIITDSIRSSLHKLGIYLFIQIFMHKRHAAKLLLSLTNGRTLSFSLFRMISVDILLPFKILGYITTYLIVILQFEKVFGSN